ncbi:MAG: hypothetical protein FGM24_07390 [Candidatus Kapabacteria bacterium]|nr:hypothetical protein [Candidatus Kapabacteria bacterium]
MRKLVQCVLMVVVIASSSIIASAQFQFPAYGPSECVATAKRALPGASDASIVAVLTAGISLPVGQSSISLGMSSKDGKSPLWIYVVRSASLDTVAFVPLVRILACIAPPVDIPIQGLDPSIFGDVALPDKFTSGTALIDALGQDSAFSAFRSKHPDSTSTFAFISGSPIGDATGLPISGAVWVVTWGGSLTDMGSGGPGSGGPPGGGLTCLHSIESGLTFCIEAPVASVSGDEAADLGIRLAPNPAHDLGLLSLPASWVGTTLTVDAIDATGTVYAIDHNARIDAPTMAMNLSMLPQGTYALRLRTPQATVHVPVVIVR